MNVSVAMATYNGAGFLRQQLASIAAQTRPPLELVISDDGSTDDSMNILTRFASEAPFDVRVFRNPVRRGHIENFLHAGRQCRGDLIAWSDQDDVWMPEKLAVSAAEFEKDTEVVFVVHSRQIGDWTRRGRPVLRGGVGGRSSAIARRRRVLTPSSLPIQFSTPGYASLLRRQVFEVATSLPVELPGGFGDDYSHDTLTGLVASALGKVVFVPDVLACYRQHANNVIGAPRYESPAERVRASVARESTDFEHNLEATAAIAAFRANLLRQLAGRIDGDGAAERAILWSRREETSRRRLRLYEPRCPRGRAAAQLLDNFARRDYGRRSGGALGPSSLVRDLYQVVRTSE